MLLAAMQLFNERGWAETTLADVAETAGVAVETIYNNFRSKKQLARDTFEAALVGDAEPVSLAERDRFRQHRRGHARGTPAGGDGLPRATPTSGRPACRRALGDAAAR